MVFDTRSVLLMLIVDTREFSFKQNQRHLLLFRNSNYLLRKCWENLLQAFKLIPFLTWRRIEHRITCPYTSKQNGIMKLKQTHNMDMGLTLLSQATLPLYFLDEAFAIATYLINQLPTLVLNNVSPLEKLFGRKPNYPSLRTFECKCFPYLQPYQSHKLSLRSQPCTFLGYSSSHKGYKW